MQEFKHRGPRGEGPEKQGPGNGTQQGGSAPQGKPGKDYFAEEATRPTGNGAPAGENGAAPNRAAGEGHSQPTGPKAGAATGKGGGLMALLQKTGLTQRQLMIAIGAIAVLAVFIITILLITLLPAKESASSSVSMSVLSSSSSQAEEDPDYDKDAFDKLVGEFDGVLLAETEDAGVEYVTDTVFLGDSNTARLVSYSATTDISMTNGIGIESMGITSVLGLRCVRFSGMADMPMPQAVALMQPRRVVINFGTNNAGMNVDTFINSYRSAIEGIQKAWPYADIIIASVIPVSQGCTYNNIRMSDIENFNIGLLELADELGLFFMNWSDALKDKSTGYAQGKFMVGDGVHISEAGAKAMVAYFRTHSFEGEDTRPKPLKPVPQRLPTPEGLFPKPSSSGSSSSSSSSSLSSSVAATTASTPVVTTPKCPDCGSTDHTVHPVAPPPTKCPDCGSTDHTVHPSPTPCPDCGSTDHTVHPAPTPCPDCGSTDHTVHPPPTPCPDCGSTDHAVHPVSTTNE